MRHFLPLALAVPSLTLRVPPRTRGTSLVPVSSPAQRHPPLLSRALGPAVPVTPVAAPTQHDESPAPPAQKRPKSSLIVVDGPAAAPPTPACLPAIAAVPSPRRSSSDLTVIFDTERCGLLPHSAHLFRRHPSLPALAGDLPDAGFVSRTLCYIYCSTRISDYVSGRRYYPAHPDASRRVGEFTRILTGANRQRPRRPPLGPPAPLRAARPPPRDLRHRRRTCPHSHPRPDRPGVTLRPESQV
jgi:hypothetical protein